MKPKMSKNNSVSSPRENDETQFNNDNNMNTKNGVVALVSTNASARGSVTVSTNSTTNLTTWAPSHRRLAIAAGKAGISIADGVLLANSAVNPAVTAAFVLYECVLAIQDYRHGALNALGYRTSKRDVALRIGKEVIGAGIGIGIGQAVGAVLGLTALPIVGQMVATAVISVGLGIFVGALLTHYADRAFTRLQIRGQYCYPSTERGAQARFEEILEDLHDLSSIEACRIVQHYMDYRVASGWESATDGDDYRAAGYPLHLLPGSLQHFTAVRLQRKWGFINERASCRKLYRALLLQHHPDRGGDAALVAQLTSDYETYAFCRGWWSDCRSFLQAAATDDVASGSDGQVRRGNPVWNFFRTLFFSGPRNSEALAQDLHAHNFLQLPGSSTSGRSPSKKGALAYPDQQSASSVNSVGSVYPDISELERSIQEEDSSSFRTDNVMTIAQQSAAVSRVLSGLHQRYQNVVEIINYTSLLRVVKDKEKKVFLLSQAESFSQTQSILHCHDVASSSLTEVPLTWGLTKNGRDKNQAWTVEKVIELREQSRKILIDHVFTEDVKGNLTQALELWRTAKDLVSNFLQSSSGKSENGHSATMLGSLNNTSTIIDTLLTIQGKLEDIPANWSESIDNADIIMSQDSGLNSDLSDLKIIGLAASSALGGEHAKTMRESVQELCESYLRVWARKQDTYQTLQEELRLVQAQLAVHLDGNRPISPSTSAVSELPSPNVLQLKENEKAYTNQLFLLEQQLFEVDSLFEEMLAICARHLPEHRHHLARIPSTVVWGISAFTDHDLHDYQFSFTDNKNSKNRYPRRLHHERESHLSFYENVQEESENPLEPCMPRLWNASSTSLFCRKEVIDICVEVDGEVKGNVGFTLLRAARVNPQSAAKSFYWVKQYNLSGIHVCEKGMHNESRGIVGELDPNAKEIPKKTKEVRQYVANKLMEDELSAASKCESPLIISPREVFSESRTCTINFLIRREPTQQRFRSVRNVQTHIMPLGLRWLHEALQCVIDLHVCDTPHGSIRLCNFVYDSFGRVSLGCFSPFHMFHGVKKTSGDVYDRDTTDFGIMILSEILPYLSVVADDEEALASSQQIYNVYREIGERLIAKVQPSFSLKDARSFVCRCIQVPMVDALGAPGGTTQTFPVEWGPKPLTDYVHLEPLPHSPFLFPNFMSHRNVNPPLWQRYNHYRCAISKASPPPPPATITTLPQFLYCSDEMEVNERFLWCRCQSQAEAWNLCYNGLSVPDNHLCYQKAFTTADIHSWLHRIPFLSLSHPMKWTNDLQGNELIIIFRVALGTVVPGEMNSPAKKGKSQYYCVNYKGLGEAVVLTSAYACYPEIVVSRSPL